MSNGKGQLSFEAFELLNLYYKSNHPKDFIKVHTQIQEINSEIAGRQVFSDTYYTRADDTEFEHLYAQWRKLIEITYEAYNRTVSDEFGKTIPSIFTDEPIDDGMEE